MKSFSVCLHITLFIASFAFFAHAEKNFVWDRTGTSGVDAQNGQNGRGPGSSGSSANQATAGLSARTVQVWVKRGENNPAVARLEFTGEQTIDVDLNDIDELVLKANGGRGGNGGVGGNGVNGEDGHKGISCGPLSGLATSGKRGQDGGSAGAGSSGMDGGDAGDIIVNVQEEDAYLLVKMAFEAKGGDGGRAGRHGQEGLGGRGGLPGDSSYYDIGEGKTISCISFASRGDDGKRGEMPNTGIFSGRSGRDGRVQIRVYTKEGTEKTYSDIFKLVWEKAEFLDENQDGILEVGERVKLKSLVLSNTGKMPVPTADLEIADPGTGLKLISNNLPKFPAGILSGTFKPVQFDAKDVSVYQINGQIDRTQASFKINGVKFKVPRQFQIASGSPLLLTVSPSLNVTDATKGVPFEINLKNLSALTFGNQAQERPLKLRLEFTGKTNSFQVLENRGWRKPSADSLVWEQSVSKISSQETVQFTGEIFPNEQALLNVNETLKISVITHGIEEGAGDKVLETKQASVTYALPAEFKDISLNQKIKPFEIHAGYPNGKRYRLNFLWIRRQANSDSLTIQYELDKWGLNNSPIYTFKLDEVRSYVPVLAREKSLTKEQVIDLICKKVAPKTEKGWKIEGCGA